MMMMMMTLPCQNMKFAGEFVTNTPSRFPLLERDGLAIPYFVLLLSFAMLPLWSGVSTKEVDRRWNSSGFGYVQ